MGVTPFILAGVVFLIVIFFNGLAVNKGGIATGLQPNLHEQAVHCPCCRFVCPAHHVAVDVQGDRRP
jgi:hypothetical protein